MIFNKGHIYHIYNQGNNRQRIFYCRENYLFFLKKIKTNLLPYADVLAWCLMPNHFHLMVYVNEREVSFVKDAQVMNSSQTPSENKMQTLNESIGIMLRSYTRAINKQEDRTGILFRPQTKANCLSLADKITKAWFKEQGGTTINMQQAEHQYPNICFNYINLNPVKDNLVKNGEDWEFSSYSDIVGLRNGTLINRARIKEFGLVLLNEGG